LFLDTAADRLYVANQGDGSVLVFDAISSKSGNAPPSRHITGVNTQLATPTSVAVDTTRDILYVADGIDVFVFSSASTADGDVPFLHQIEVGFQIPAMVVDGANNRLFLADAGANAINVYDNASTLDSSTNSLPPSRSITSSDLHQPSGLAIDPLGRLIVGNSSPASITVYANAASASGTPPSIITLTGSSTTLSAPSQIAVSNSSTLVEVYVANTNGGNVPVFSNLGATAGNVSPTRNITGPSTTLTVAGRPTARGIALDPTR
ncbi:MAG: hypothetical protein ACRD4F_00150, partial [Candidatus Angelobacter sp.]